MKFLDLYGLTTLLKHINTNFCTAMVNISDYQNKTDASGYISIPFVANHQIVIMDITKITNVYNWFQKASKGGTLEIVFAGSQGANTYCSNDDNSYMYKMQLSPHGPIINNIEYLPTIYNTYTRLIKTDSNKLVVAEFVQNK